MSTVCTEGVSISYFHTGCRLMVLGHSCALLTIQTWYPCGSYVYYPPPKPPKRPFPVSVHPFSPPPGVVWAGICFCIHDFLQECPEPLSPKSLQENILPAAQAFDRLLWECASPVTCLHWDKSWGNCLCTRQCYPRMETFRDDGNVLDLCCL